MGLVIWLTGLSGSGKTSLAVDVKAKMDKLDYRKTEIIDGDILRDLFPKLGFSREDRKENVKRAAYIAAYLAHFYNKNVICSLISPYSEDRNEVRKICGKNFIEVFVKCSLQECINRDVKGLYKKAIAGEIKNFTGISDPYEEPSSPDLIINTLNISLDKCSEILFEKIIELTI